MVFAASVSDIFAAVQVSVESKQSSGKKLHIRGRAGEIWFHFFFSKPRISECARYDNRTCQLGMQRLTGLTINCALKRHGLS